MSTICMYTFLFMQLIDLSYSSEPVAYQVHQPDRPLCSVWFFCYYTVYYFLVSICNWWVSGVCSLASPYMLYIDVS